MRFGPFSAESLMQLDRPLAGPRVTLTSLDESAADGPYLSWMRDPEMLRGLEARFRDHSPETLRRYIGDMNARDDVLFLGIFLCDTQEHVGNIKLTIDPHHRRGSIGIIVGARAHRGKGHATEAIRLMADNAFTTLDLVKLTAGCYGSNPASEKAFVKAGFVVEARRPMHFFDEGHWVDFVLLGRINPAYQAMHSSRG